MSSTPLSDKISALIGNNGTGFLQDLQQTFLLSHLGIVVHGLPRKAHGEKHIVENKKNLITCSLVNDPNGNPMIKACADPDVFEAKYKAGINATMSGREILEMLIKLPDVKGVLICSATSFNSFPIYTEGARILLMNANDNLASKKTWWKFW